MHTLRVGVLPNRLNIPDTRGSGAYLRVTRHPDHWRDSICAASTPVDISELPSLIGLLAEALGDAVVMPGPASRSRPTKPSAWSKLRDRIRPALAKVVEIHTKPARRDGPLRSDVAVQVDVHGTTG